MRVLHWRIPLKQFRKLLVGWELVGMVGHKPDQGPIFYVRVGGEILLVQCA